MLSASDHWSSGLFGRLWARVWVLNVISDEKYEVSESTATWQDTSMISLWAQFKWPLSKGNCWNVKIVSSRSVSPQNQHNCSSGLNYCPTVGRFKQGAFTFTKGGKPLNSILQVSLFNYGTDVWCSWYLDERNFLNKNIQIIIIWWYNLVVRLSNQTLLNFLVESSAFFHLYYLKSFQALLKLLKHTIYRYII